jgi:hypothetical protein
MTAEATTSEQRPSGSGIWVQLAMTAVSLAVLGGIVLWQVRTDGGEAAMPAARSAPQSSVTQGSISDGATPRGGPAGLDAAQAWTAVWTVYIVESQERAQGLRAGLEHVNAFRATQGQPPLTAQVVSFDSSESESYLWQSLSWVPGLPGAALPVAVIDLRGR